MTYNIDHIGSPYTGLIVLWIIVTVLVIVAAAAVAAREKVAHPRCRRAVAWSLLVLGALGVTGGATAAVIDHNRLQHERISAVQDAWGLNRSDASYLYAARQSQGHWGGPDLAVITLHGKSAKGYILAQGSSLRLIVGGKPVPVTGR